MADKMWVLVMFDLPTLTKPQRRAAGKYRLLLRDLGFGMTQLSVYSKYLVNATGLLPILPELKRNVPANGEVRVIKLTDDQWAGMYRYYGPVETKVEPAPTQLALFDDEFFEDEDEF
jgi:CRISPR-associated protein Cas2